jgi:dTDP-4-dehydrorhamnose 3,5-epimerase
MAFFKETEIVGLYQFQINPRFQDERGSFSKPFHVTFLEEHGIKFECKESFLTFSHQNVLRGLHFQSPPHAHDKIVSCFAGSVFDVVVDLRKSSKTYGSVLSFELNENNNEALLIPVGCAHGFKVLSKAGAWMAYYTTKEHAQASDHGVLWSSFSVDWPGGVSIVSPRDAKFPDWKDVGFFL